MMKEKEQPADKEQSFQHKPSDWIRKLQRESWELEMLTSGISIFLLFQIPSHLEEANTYIADNFARNNLSAAVSLLLFMFHISAYVVIFNLLLHLISRGFWIGVIGLHSVFPEGVKFEKLSYSELFNKKLKQNIPGLDVWTIYLDNVCSVIFGFTFLIILSLISLGLYFIFFLVTVYILSIMLGWIESLLGESNFYFEVIFLMTPVLLFVFAGLIYLIDFFTLGAIKKGRRISKIYYPIYKLSSYITLSFLYRPIYYTFISNISKRKIGLFLGVYILFILAVNITSYHSHIYFPEEPEKEILKNNYYDNLRPHDARIEKASIQADIIREKYVRLFIYYDMHDNNLIREICPEYTPEKQEGLSTIFSGWQFKLSDRAFLVGPKEKDEQANKLALQCLSSFYNIYINDSLHQNPEFFFYEFPNKKEKGIITYLSAQGLKKGKNTLHIKKKIKKEEGEITERNYAFIPFWLE